jgi:transposase
MSRAAEALDATEGQREVLDALARSQTLPFRVVQRARALLLAADGVSNVEIAQMVGVSRPTVLDWRAEFMQRGLVDFGEVGKGRGRKPSIPAEKIAQVVDLTLHSKPEGHTHWSCRTMARATGISSATVQRIWAARGLQPHRVDRFKLSNDKRFEEKLTDVVGLYLNPPDKAAVLCTDEKSRDPGVGSHPAQPADQTGPGGHHDP